MHGKREHCTQCSPRFVIALNSTLPLPSLPLSLPPGLLTDDPSLYRPNSFGSAPILPLLPTAERLREQLYKEGEVDCVLAMTHQVRKRKEEGRKVGDSIEGDWKGAHPIYITHQQSLPPSLRSSPSPWTVP